MIIQLFYSAQCKACNELWTVILNEGMQRMFTPVCLDNMNPKTIAELKLERIPAIVISSEDKLQPVIYEGSKSCSEWLNTVIQNRRNTLKQQIENQRKLIQQKQVAARIKEQGALEYISEEMDGVTDTYSYVATDLYQPKNFVPVGQEQNFNVITPQDKERKFTHEDLSIQMKNIIGTRSKDTNEYQKIMEQQQIQSVLNNQINGTF